MKTHLNLVPEKSHKRNQMRRCVRVWIRVILACSLLISIAGIAQWKLFSRERERLASIEAEYEPIRQLKIENGRMRKQLSELQESEGFALKLAKDQPLLGMIALPSEAAAANSNSIYLKRVEIVHTPIGISDDIGNEIELSIDGVSIDKKSAELFANSLRESQAFRTVNVKSGAFTTVGQQSHHLFHIECMH